MKRYLLVNSYTGCLIRDYDDYESAIVRLYNLQNKDNCIYDNDTKRITFYDEYFRSTL